MAQPIATLSLFRFEGFGARAWALGQMQFAHRALRRIDGLTFYKLCGTARGFGSPMDANLSVFALLGSWTSAERARAGTRDEPIFQAYRRRCAEECRIEMRAVSCKGRWSGASPFGAEQADRDAASAELSPVAVVTRATIRPRHMLSFWREAPTISRMIAQDPNVLFALGMGELPWRNQITYSIWPDVASMRAFAYRDAHAQAARAAFKQGWFREDLFARFQVLGASGAWGGRPAENLMSTRRTAHA